MTAFQPIQIPAPPAKPTLQENERWLEALRFLARHHGLTLSEQSARLAGQWDDSHTFEDRVATMARRLGLRVTFSDPASLRLSSLHLPLLAEMRDGSLALVSAISAGEVVVAPADCPALPHRMLLEEFGSKALRYIQARPAGGLSDERVDLYVKPYDEGWLRRILTADLPRYGHVLLASFICNVLALAGIVFSMQVYDRVVPAESMPTLMVLFLGVVLAIALDFILRRMRMTIVDVLGKRADLRMSDLVFGHALRVKASARPQSTGSFIAQLRDLEQVREVLGSTTLAAVADIPFFILFAAVMFYLVGALALVPLGALVLLVVPGLLAQRRMREHATAAMREASLRNAMLVEAVQGLEDIKTLQAEERFQRQWRHYTEVAGEAQLRLRGLTNGLTVWTHNVQSGVYATIIFVGAPMVIAGDITTGVLVGASVLGSRMLAPMAHLTQVFSRLQQARIGARSLDAIMQLPVDHPEGESRIALPSASGELALRHTRFGYEPSRPILAIDDLTIAPGERIALLGRNGAGKSTLLQGLSGLLDPLEGQILLDGLNLAQIDPADSRREVGLLGANSRLFHGTIRENLTLGAPLASDEAIMRALAAVGADRFVSGLQSGLDYRLREGGGGLSAGQAQALLLARLLLREPTVLLLDEPSAAMDELTERHFVEQLGAWSRGRTLVIATHRTRLLDVVDRVIVLDKGRIASDQPRARFLATQARAAAIQAQTSSEARAQAGGTR
ncbi:type I secretion system permease/ATPase [Aurantiacibacter xanthus]|uniref:Type I secretion system permease/ATPase n=1 Tax=Aurantiacibacter xanthus TaxID=1784712 RepID=A0A3A1P4J6_9SPHN|nr:type I secretion system permease/ATPase [Aurantiacibacter xanthus]RIV84147.1 type I secretion system permease/ATPase [Aurantiacibacter xanthus]